MLPILGTEGTSAIENGSIERISELRIKKAETVLISLITLMSFVALHNPETTRKESRAYLPGVAFARFIIDRRKE